MAPKIKVPANFGVEHINSPVHGNLLLKLRDGQEIRTNSMIMSFNSPVIDKLTTNLFQVKISRAGLLVKLVTGQLCVFNIITMKRLFKTMFN